MNPYAIEEVIAFLWRAYKAYGQIEKADDLITTIRENEYISANSWKMTSIIFFVSIFRYLGAKSKTSTVYSDGELIEHALKFVDLNRRLTTPRTGTDFSVTFIAASHSYYLNFMRPKLDDAIKIIATAELDRYAVPATTSKVLAASASVFIGNAKTLGLLASDTYTTSVLKLKFTSVYDQLYQDLVAAAKKAESTRSGNGFFSSNYFVLLYNKLQTKEKHSEDASHSTFFERGSAYLAPVIFHPLFEDQFDYNTLPHPLSSHATPLPKPRSLASEMQEGMKAAIKTLNNK